MAKNKTPKSSTLLYKRDVREGTQIQIMRYAHQPGSILKMCIKSKSPMPGKS